MNNFSFTGRLTQDSELKTTASGLSILSFSVANNTGYGDKQKTNYVNCALFGKRAEGRLKDYLKKGQEVAVTGELNLNKFTKADGQQSASLECNVNNVDLIGGRNAQSAKNETISEQSAQVPPQRILEEDDLGEVPF